jgi:hypothetical protein
VGGEVRARLGERLAFPEGFFREGRAGGWRESWGPAQRAVFDRVAGDLLLELGYEPDRSWARPQGAAARARARVAAAAVVAGRAGRRVRARRGGGGAG